MIDKKNIQLYSGAGNDFLILNNLDNNYSDYLKIVLYLMKQELYSKFDGVIFIEKSNIADFKMNYYNRDGTTNSLCGNGLRCTAQYVKDNSFINRNELTVESIGNVYKLAFLDNGLISTYFPSPKVINPEINLKINLDKWHQDLKCSYIDCGSPHIVIFIENLNINGKKISSLDEIDVINFGRYIRHHKDLLPEGANVNFVKIISAEDSLVESRVYERGVEDETLASGTGSISVGVTCFITKGINPPISIKTRLDETLIVDFTFENEKISKIILTGKAQRIKNK
jgi:diaminopimelate epimerase